MNTFIKFECEVNNIVRLTTPSIFIVVSISICQWYNQNTPQFCDFSKVGLGRTFDVAYMRNHISKVRPLYIIYDNKL